MTDLKLVIFDLGKVLVDFDFSKVCSGLARRSPRSAEEIRQFFLSTPLWDTFERGHLTPAEFFEQLRTELKLSMTYEEFLPLWNDIFTEMPETTALLRRLKGRVPIYLLSNVNSLHFDFILERYPFMALFDERISSCGVGMRKPEPGLFEHVLRKAGARPEETFFTDDMPAHVESARKLGIRGFHFQSPEGLRRELSGYFEGL